MTSAATAAIQKGCTYIDLTMNPRIGFQFCVSKHPDMRNSVRHPEKELFSSSFLYDLLQEIPEVTINTFKTLELFIYRKPLDDIKPYILAKRVPHRCPYACNTGNEPSDVDTTAIRLWNKMKSGFLDLEKEDEKESAKKLAEKLALNYFISRGTICSFNVTSNEEFSEEDMKKGVDVGVMSNVMRVLYVLELDDQALQTEDFVLKWLHRRKKRRTYYWSEDWPIYLYSNCIPLSRRVKLKFTDILVQRLWERVGSTQSPLDIAMRIITGHNLGLIKAPSKEKNEDEKNVERSGHLKNLIEALRMEVKRLRGMQRDDGSWKGESILINNVGHHLGSDLHTTCFALKALDVSRHLGF